MNRNPIIIALDASTTNIGWCLAQDDRYLNSGTEHIRGDLEKRIRRIIAWISAQVSIHSPDLVAIEKPYGDHGNRHTDRELARVYGGIEAACLLSGVEVMEIHPTAVKATSFSKENPQRAARFVRKAESVGPDEADAIGVWQAALGALQERRFYACVEPPS
jgi:Holliday junction resolvasome RuvABC endonuclease subunit